MNAPRPRVVVVNGVPMSALIAERPSRGPSSLLLHGGGTTGLYFDCPGHPELSLLRTGAAHGFTVIALDRPGYGSSAPYPEAMAQPEQRVAWPTVQSTAFVGELARGVGSCSVFAHSERLRTATGDGRRPVAVGICSASEIAGTGLRYQPAAREVLKAASATHRPPGLRELLWQPTELYPADVIVASRARRRAGCMKRQWSPTGLAATSRRWPRRYEFRCSSALPNTKRSGSPIPLRWPRLPTCFPPHPDHPQSPARRGPQPQPWPHCRRLSPTRLCVHRRMCAQ
ncbi:alpha/beta fold hydrolase [Mycolicibacterium vaccae]|nr:alpha/beta fold hydrolase [Mycolicibacterium vaccae]